MNETFLSNIDLAKIEEIYNNTETNVEQFNNITNNLVCAYTKDIDELMLRVDADVVQNDASDYNFI